MNLIDSFHRHSIDMALSLVLTSFCVSLTIYLSFIQFNSISFEPDKYNFLNNLIIFD